MSSNSSSTTTTSNNNKAIFSDAEVSLIFLEFFFKFFSFQTDPFQGLDVSRLSNEDIIARSRLLDNEVKVCRFLESFFISKIFIFKIMKNDIVRISHETQSMRDRIKDNKEKIKVNKTLPYLVSNVIEV